MLKKNFRSVQNAYPDSNSKIAFLNFRIHSSAYFRMLRGYFSAFIP